MNILIIPDKFKSSLSSEQAAQAIARGLMNTQAQNLNISSLGMADGGDGSAAVMQKYTHKSIKIQCHAIGPLGDKVDSSYLLYKDSNDTQCAFIEMAQVAGLSMLHQHSRNPWLTSTYGVGTLIKDAISKGASVLNISIGGSASNDGGTGMLQSLGFAFELDESSAYSANFPHNYMCGGRLKDIKSIKINNSIPPHVSFNVICDVDNPLLGERGATMVYSAQKGANINMMQALEEGMKHYANLSGRILNCNSNYPGAGAAGGLGYALKSFLGAKIITGWEFFSQLSSLEEKISKADLVISGEGKIDSQSLQGKLLDGMIKLSGKYNKELILFCGKKEIELTGRKVYSLEEIEPNLDICMKDAERLLEELSYNVFKKYFIF